MNHSVNNANSVIDEGPFFFSFFYFFYFTRARGSSLQGAVAIFSLVTLYCILLDIEWMPDKTVIMGQ